MFPITLKAAKITAVIVILISFSAVAGRLFAMLDIPGQLVNAITAMNIPKVSFFLLLNVMLLIVGMFMETNTSILILTPLLLPVVTQVYGMDPIHFGAMLLVNLQIGMLTPPFAGNLFVATKVANIQFNKIVRPVISYILVMLPVLAITTMFPKFSTFLVNLLK